MRIESEIPVSARRETAELWGLGLGRIFCEDNVMLKMCLLSTILLVAALSFCPNVDAQPQHQLVQGPIEVRLTTDARKTWMEPGTILGALGVLGGFAGMLLQQYWHRRDAEQARLQAHVLDSLKWFEGKTQKRSIGIAVVEGNWDRFPDLRAMWVPILTNQAEYLLAESGQDDAIHERENLIRIMRLLLAARTTLTPDQKAGIRDAMGKNSNGAGLRGLGHAILQDWSDQLTGS
jgi:hypothetical protein